MRVVYVLVVAIWAVASCRAQSWLKARDVQPVLKRPRTGPHIDFPNQYRILENNVARPGQFPYQALIKADGKYISAGSLISESAVLTSASTVIGFSSWYITLGSNLLHEVGNTTWITKSTWATVHPEYNSTYFYYDVAIIVLIKRAPLGTFIMPVALPKLNEVHETYATQFGLVAGWGYPLNSNTLSKNLLFAEVTVVPNDICKKLYGRGYIVESTLCAASGNRVLSSGDSGTALVILTDKGYKQIGVASFWGEDGWTTAVLPAGYTRVTSILDWIRKQTGIRN